MHSDRQLRAPLTALLTLCSLAACTSSSTGFDASSGADASAMDAAPDAMVLDAALMDAAALDAAPRDASTPDSGLRYCGLGTLATNGTSTVTAFQQKQVVLGFDELPGNGGGGSNGNTGVPIDSASAVTDHYIGRGVRFSSAGGPGAVVSVQGLPNQSDAHSPYNILGGSSLNGTTPVLNYRSPIQLDFVLPGTTTPTTVERVGAWNDPTGSKIHLEVFDSRGTSIQSIDGDQGLFVAIKHPGIARAVFSWIQDETAQGFDLDDVTFTSSASGCRR